MHGPDRPLYHRRPWGADTACIGREKCRVWLTKWSGYESGAKIRRGQVSSTGQGLRVQGESEYNSPEMLFPYGYSSAAADGKQAVMLDGVCAGIAASLDGELSQGEVRLYSAGGAEILLKNTGEVVINGQSFPPKS